MKRLLFLMMMLYSGYSFCGCVDCGSVTLNGKLIAWFCPSDTNFPETMPIDSNYVYNNNDTVFISPNDSAILGVGKSVIRFTNDIDTEYIYTNYNGTYSLTKTGLYYIQQTDYDINCGQRYFLYFVVISFPTGINNVSPQETSIKVLSNPVSSTLKLNSQQTINHLNIYDELGRLELSSEPTTTSQYIYEVGVDALAKGVYIVEATLDTDKKDYIKIVKQ